MTVETQYIDKLREAAKTRYVRTYWLACAFMPRSAIRTKAFAELERSYEDKDLFSAPGENRSGDGSVARRPAIQGDPETPESARMNLKG